MERVALLLLLSVANSVTGGLIPSKITRFGKENVFAP
jgi:nicotinamide mononucleotide (NMN) deamidase PncC